MEGDGFNVDIKKKALQEEEESSGTNFNENKVGLKTFGRRRQNITGTTAVSKVCVAIQEFTGIGMVCSVAVGLLTILGLI